MALRRGCLPSGARTASVRVARKTRALVPAGVASIVRGSARGEGGASTRSVGMSADSTSSPSQQVPLEQLSIGDERAGVVIDIKKPGAFVNVGAPSDGLLPRSAVIDGQLEQYVSVGTNRQFVVSDVNASQNTLILSLPPGVERIDRPPKLDPSELEVGTTLNGVIVSVKSPGCFIDVGVPGDALLPRSRMPPGSENLQSGDTVRVAVSEVDLNSNLFIVDFPPDDGESSSRESFS